MKLRTIKESINEAKKAIKMSPKETLDYINSHREATGHKLFTKLSPKEMERHMALIDANAPYGDDPWDKSVKEAEESQPPAESPIDIVCFIGSDGEGDRGVKYAIKKGTLDKKLFKELKTEAATDIIKGLFPKKFEDAETETWAENEDFSEKEYDDILKELETTPWVWIGADYM